MKTKYSHCFYWLEARCLPERADRRSRRGGWYGYMRRPRPPVYSYTPYRLCVARLTWVGGYRYRPARRYTGMLAIGRGPYAAARWYAPRYYEHRYHPGYRCGAN